LRPNDKAFRFGFLRTDPEESEAAIPKEFSMNKVMRFVLVVTVLLAAHALAATAYLIPVLGVPLALGAMIGLARKGRQLYAHGTARWAQSSDIPHLIRGGDGLILGHIEGKPSKIDGIKGLFNRRLPAWLAVQMFLETCQPKATRHLVRLNTSVHTCVVAPTGVGKGVSCVIPFLLTNRDSCVVVDFKGELARLTAAARRKMGHRCILLDPYRTVTEEPDSFNPLDFISPESELAIDDCRDVAEALVVRTGQEKDPFWNDAAETWLTAMSALLINLKPDIAANLSELKTLVSDTTLMKQAIVKMIESDAWDGVLARLGHTLTHSQDKELNSTLTSTNRHLRFIDSPAIAASTAASSFDPAGLLTGKMTIYLILPPDRIRSQSGLLRLWVGSLFRAVIRGGLQETHKINFILDEAASLGRMEAVDDAIDKYRGYGIRLFLYYQSLGQLKKCFPDDQGQTLLSNTTQVFFGVNDQQTAEYVSNRLGEQTIVVASGGTSRGGSHSSDAKSGSSSSGSSWNQSDNWQQHARKLLKPEEVTALSKGVAITLTPDAPPLWTRLIRYYDWDFKKSRGIGPVKAVVDTACLFLLATMAAAFVTAALIYGFSEQPHVQANQGIDRAGEVGR
jgi:type IV secretion system protein VirD4